MNMITIEREIPEEMKPYIDSTTNFGKMQFFCILIF